MPEFDEKQSLIEQRRQTAIADYPHQWSHMIEMWRENSDEDCAFLTYSANYLFRTGGVRWAIDPLTLRRRVPTAKQVDIARDLSDLEFVILTHQHADHIDDALIHDLRNTPIRWVVPKPILSKVLQFGLLEKNIIIPVDLKPISLGGVSIVPFEGLHWQKIHRDEIVEIHGVPSTSYMVEFQGKRWLFPGDVRDYDVDALPGFGILDGVFAHLWLGRRCALMEPPPLVNAFRTFFSSLKPKRIVITHLEELGRNALDYWDDSHYQLVRSRIQQMTPGINISAAYMGDKVIL
jgi:phosphoribosyl 1,2-cyclic phosphodiesterase